MSIYEKDLPWVLLVEVCCAKLSLCFWLPSPLVQNVGAVRSLVLFTKPVNWLHLTRSYSLGSMNSFKIHWIHVQGHPLPLVVIQFIPISKNKNVQKSNYQGWLVSISSSNLFGVFAGHVIHVFFSSSFFLCFWEAFRKIECRHLLGIPFFETTPILFFFGCYTVPTGNHWKNKRKRKLQEVFTLHKLSPHS